MNIQLIVKEWKEKLWILFSALGFLLIFALAIRFFGKWSPPDYLAWFVLIFFLPVIGITLGAGAFSSEFKDGAWAYLFSRPLKKSTVWISKFAALLAIFLVVLLTYLLVLPHIHGSARSSAAVHDLWRGGLLLSLTLFCLSFFLSFLTDKQLVVVFLTLFSAIGIATISYAATEIFEPYADEPALPILMVWTFLTVAIGAASLRTFCRADFSQSSAKIGIFLKSAAGGLVLAAALSAIGFQMEARLHHLTYLRLIPNENEMVFDSSRGVYRYDSGRNQAVKMKSRSIGLMAASGGNIVWLEGDSETEWRLNIMDGNGKNKRTILTADRTTSSLAGQMVKDISLSRDGRAILAISCHETDPTKIFFWKLDANGTSIKSIPVDLPPADFAQVIDWTSDSRRAVLVISVLPEKRDSHRRILRPYVLSPEAGELKELPDSVSWIGFFGPSPDGNRLGFFSPATDENNSSLRSLRIFDLETGSSENLVSLPGLIQACWNPSGDQIAFLAEGGRRLGIVSVAEKKILSEHAIKTTEIDRLPRTMAWTKNGRNIALSSLEDSEYVLRIYDSALNTEKIFPIPRGRKPLENLPHVYGAGDKILVLDFPSSRLWSFDAEKEHWTKLF